MNRVDLLAAFDRIRGLSEALAKPLEIEDYVLQAMEDASPPLWNLAHTSWFFETFLLAPFQKGYAPYHPAYEHLFNSYYNTVGKQFPRPSRGMISRPGLARIRDYRSFVDDQMNRRMESGDLSDEAWHAIQVGLNHRALVAILRSTPQRAAARIVASIVGAVHKNVLAEIPVGRDPRTVRYQPTALSVPRPARR